MKKVFWLISAIVLCAALLISFSACSNSKSNDPAIAENTSDTSAAEAVSNTDAATKPGQGKSVYFAGPLFNQAEKDFNLKLAKVLEENGYEVFLPQRDGIEAALLEGKSEEELVEMIFALDAGEVKKADIIFMNLDGRVPDEGACVELGIEYGSGKRCYGFKTDTRSVELGMDLNPMISGCMTKIFKIFDGDQLIEDIKQYLANNEL